MAEKIKTLWARILAIIAALLSGLIFILGSLRAQFFGQSFFEYLTMQLGLDAALASTFNILMTIASFAGWIIFAAAICIALRRERIAKIILLIVVGTGLLSFFIPVVAALANGSLTMDVLLNGDATKFLVATLFGMIAKLYVDKLT